jgi:hypothetical protein
MIYLLLYVTVVTPFQLSFLETPNPGDIEMNLPGVLFFADRLLDLFFLADIFISFHLTYFDSEKGAYESNVKEIRLHYIKGWLIIDVISVVPFDLIVNDRNSMSASTVRLLRAIKLLKLVRLLKIMRGGRLVEVLQRTFGASFLLVKCLCMMLTLVHWTACLW